MLEGDLSNLSPGAKIRAHHGGLEEGFHQLPWGFGIPRVSRPQNWSNPLLLFGPLPQCLVWFIQWLWQVKKNLIKSVFVWPFEWMPLSMQVENDLNFSVLLQYLASFAHDLPQPLEVKAGWNRRLSKTGQTLENNMMRFHGDWFCIPPQLAFYIQIVYISF